MESQKTRRDMLAVAAGAVAVGVVASTVATPAQADQGNMEHAIDLCNKAIEALRAAPDNKGGHKRRAVQMIQTAVDEIQAGIEWADTH